MPVIPSSVWTSTIAFVSPHARPKRHTSGNVVRDRDDVDVNASDFHGPLPDLEVVRRVSRASNMVHNTCVGATSTFLKSDRRDLPEADERNGAKAVVRQAGELTIAFVAKASPARGRRDDRSSTMRSSRGWRG